MVFVDGQNLFYAAKQVFGYTYPNYDIALLSAKVCQQQNWQLTQTRFYTGIPNSDDDATWSHFWKAKLAQMGRQGVHVFSRPLRYRLHTIRLPDGRPYSVPVAQEKGVDVRLAIDVVGLAYRNQFDVAIIFSQDQDLSEVADEIRVIAKEQNRWLKIASAFPISPVPHNARGINGTDWITIDRMTYDACLDTRDYRLKRRSKS